MCRQLFWLAFFLVGNVLIHGISHEDQELTVLKAERLIDISSQVVKVTVSYDLQNDGKTEFNSFLHVVSEEEQSHLAYIAAVDKKRDTKIRIVKMDRTPFYLSKEGFVAYKVEFLNLLASKNKLAITVEYHLIKVLQPYPTMITQSEQQFVLYKGNVHVASPYPVLEETTTYILPPGKLESHTLVQPTKVEGSKIVYGPYKDQKPLSKEIITIHTESNAPFVVATEVLRTIEVSHWGNIAVEEYISLIHQGAELKGPFSRVDFTMDRRGNKRPVVTHFKTLLPALAKDIYYRDEIGNISTSTVRKMADNVELTIQPRFPLMGGWRTDYVLGYNVPAYQYLYSSENHFSLKLRVIDHLFSNAVVEHLVLKIILPEGSKNFKLITPYHVVRRPDELHFTYLDVTGRPVVVIEKDKLVDAHIQQFTLNYEFDRIQLWREPLLACFAFALLFSVVIAYVRLDFTISPNAATESRLQAQGQVEQLGDLHADRLKLYDQYVDAAHKFRNNKDPVMFLATKKKLENDLRNIAQSIADLQCEFKASNAEIAEKLNDVNKIHKNATEVIGNYLTQVERLVKGQLSKTAFADMEKVFAQKFNEAKEKMDAIIYAL